MALLTPHWALDSILIFASLIIGAYMYATRKFRYWLKRGVKELPPTPFVGNFGDCITQKKSASMFTRDLYEQFKGEPYVGFYIFDKPFFLVRDPELVKHVLVKDFSLFVDRYVAADVSDRLGYSNLFIMKNPGWKTLRSKLTPVFTSGKLKKMVNLMIPVADELDRLLEESTSATPTMMEMKDLAAKFTTDLIATTVFGLQVNSLHNPKDPFREFGSKIFEFNVLRGLEFLVIFFLPYLAKPTRAKFFGKETSEYLRTVFWEVMNRRIQTGEKRNDLIDILIELKQTHENEGSIDGVQFSGDDLVAQAATFFTAGFETTSSVIAFCLHELALHMDVQTTLRNEILDALEKNDGKITYDMIMTLPYLDMVVSETLRKHPPLGFLERVVNTNYKVPNSDLILEKGTPVYISMFGMHYDPEYFPDPEKFDPSRFTDENKQNRPSFTYFPFGEGPRNCIGLRMGLMQSKLGLFKIISKCEVSRCEKTTDKLILDPRATTTASLMGVHVNIRKIVTGVR
ncbi:cytochrome P450 6k1-like [Lasioglossum baleicum]|uniref:cytochrome P450 6k1-like n=1 Tax=Lasioglossum baleicum TaxID=434251 RepID=UPI003FCE9F8D